MITEARKLLLVDDDAATLRVLSRVLSDYPDQHLATCGAQALALARAESPDLMLIDMEMPGMSGAQLCAMVKSDPQLSHVPVLFVTSDDSEETRLEALQLGAADFITKPVAADQLKARVAALLRNATQIELSKAEIASSGGLGREMLHTGPSRLLVVDDDVGAIEMLRHTLRGLGEVRAAGDGESAMELVKTWRPDLILVDVLMTGMDGFELCSRIHAIAGLGHVPVVFVTRLSDAQYETRALEMGAADFIAKPYSPSILKARIRNLLELKRRTDIELTVMASQGQRLAADRLAAVVEGASDGIVTINATGHIALMNAAAGRMLNTDHLSAPGQAATALIGSRIPGLKLDSPAPPLGVLLPQQTGPDLPAEVSISSVGEGNMRLTTLMFRDVTDRHLLLAESSARCAAEAANRTKALMISYVAHEIGNPLNCILSFAYLLGNDSAAPLSAPQAHRLSMIELGCMQLNSLVKDLSALGHFELGKLHVKRQPIDVAAVIDAALQTTSALAQHTGVELVTGELPSSGTCAVGDPDRLRQCLINLISNGIKYNTPGGRVQVEVRGHANTLEITISDTGAGMNEEQVAHLFEPFNRLGRESTTMPGTGLGLVITRQLIDAMGGRLSVTSCVNEGSCFAIHLPLDMAGTAGAEATPAVAVQSGGR